MNSISNNPAASHEPFGLPLQPFAFFTSASRKERRDYLWGTIVTAVAVAIICYETAKTPERLESLLSSTCMGVCAVLSLMTLAGFIRTEDKARKAPAADAQLERLLRSEFKVDDGVNLYSHEPPSLVILHTTSLRLAFLRSDITALETYLAVNYPELAEKLQAANLTVGP
jgi:hypothetical protein